MTDLLPIHVLYPNVLEKSVHKIIHQLHNALIGEKFPFTIKVVPICLGKIWRIPIIQNSAISYNAGSNQYQVELDFGGGLSQVLRDYNNDNKNSAWGNLLEPEIVTFLTSDYRLSPKIDWEDVWKEIIGKFNAKVFLRLLMNNPEEIKLDKLKTWFPGTPPVQLDLSRPIMTAKSSIENLLEQSIMGQGGYCYLLKSKAKGIKPVSIHIQNKSATHSIIAPSIVTNNVKVSPSPASPPPSSEAIAKSTIPPQTSDAMSHSQIITIAKEELTAPKSIELKPAQPAEWQVKEPTEEKDRTAHTQNQTLNAGDWYICGASRRGKLHENEATFREDAFAVQYAGGWILVAVADGAGSHHLSRVGSNLSVKVAIEMLTDKVTNKPPQEDYIAGFLENALDESLLALSRESVKRNIDIRDLSTTLLLLMFNERKNLIGVAQVGDGLLAVQFTDGEVAPLGNPESGEYSGQTYFLTNHQKGSFKNNVSVLKPDKDLKYFFVMTDGVADDLYPPTERLPGLIKAIPEVIVSDYPDKALLELINYNRPGSFDDRTLVVVCKRNEIVKEAPAQAPQQTPEAKSLEPQPAQQESAPTAREEKPTVSSVATDTSVDKITGKEQESSEIPSSPIDDTAGNAAGIK